MVYTTPIACANVERFCYLFFQNKAGTVNKCFGKFLEQENDAGEVQYIFDIDKSVLTEEDLDELVLPGIDLTLDRTVYVRSYNIPYFVECSTIQNQRGDLNYWLKLHHLDYNDKFEYMMRSRAITQKTNCYLGRFPTDFEDANRIKDDDVYARSILPNLNEVLENTWHEITENRYDEY